MKTELNLFVIVLLFAVGMTFALSCNTPVVKQVEREYEDVRSITVVDINGDTVIITGGATCHLDKKITH